MHELAICQAMLAQVEEIARTRGASRAENIVLLIGPLSGVEIPLLQRAFSVARVGTVAAGARLECETCPIRVCCRSCGATSTVNVNRLLCSRCGAWQVDVLEGEEMLLKTVELAGLTAAASDDAMNGAQRHV